MQRAVRVAMAYVGAAVGFFLPCTSGELCNLGGAPLGAVGVSALFAAMPLRGSGCSYQGRAMVALPFAVLGGVLGVAASGGNEGVLITVPVGTALGAAMGATIC